MTYHRAYPPSTHSDTHPYASITPTGQLPQLSPCPQHTDRLNTPRVAALVQLPLPTAIVNANGTQPFAGMDPSDRATWVRPWNPQPGMVPRLNFDGAQRQSDTPMGGTWRNPMRDRADVPAPRPRWFGRRRHTA
jgi:hypothetical protein